MQSLESELARARGLSVSDLADAIETIGFECTRCGACCTRDDDDPHTATVFPDEVRTLTSAAGGGDAGSGDDADDGVGSAEDAGDAGEGGPVEWRDVARPMPYGLAEGDDGPAGETFEWALQTDACGDCVFYEEADGVGACSVHEDRPLICATYPFSLALDGTSQPMGEAVESVALPARREDADADAGEEWGADGAGDADEGGMVRAHECEGLGRDISRAEAEDLAATLKERAVRELEEAIGVRDRYAPADPGPGEVVVHDSEGPKRPDGTPLE